MNEFEKTIEAYLDEYAIKDETFRGKLEQCRKDGKNTQRCCEYIYGWVKAQHRAGFTDPEIFDQAVHYYDELGNVKYQAVRPSQVVVNHEVALSKSEKQRARNKAREAFEKAELARLQAEAKKEAEKAAEQARRAKEREERAAEQARRKAEEKRARQSAGMMDLFGDVTL